MLKIATWNVNSLKIRLLHVQDWLEQEQPDILALQETKLTDENFPIASFHAMGYNAIFSGQKTYNGVAIISREAATAWNAGIPGYSDPQQRVLRADIAGIHILNVYVPNGSEVGSDKYKYKIDWFVQLYSYLQKLRKDDKPLILLGDFNIAPEDIDVHDPAEWAGKVLVSDPERAEFRRLLALGLSDCYRLFDQEPNGFSWWDYRAGGFRRNRGLRIDHILASTSLAASCVACTIDKRPRTLERPSDHTPVIAVFNQEQRNLHT